MEEYIEQLKNAETIGEQIDTLHLLLIRISYEQTENLRVICSLLKNAIDDGFLDLHDVGRIAEIIGVEFQNVRFGSKKKDDDVLHS